MQFDHDNMTGVRLSVDLVNLRADGAWTPERVVGALRDHEIRRIDVDVDTIAGLHDWTALLRGPFDAGTVDERCDAVNALLAAGTAGIYLTAHDAWRPHLHFTPETESLLGRVRAVTAGGLAVFTTEAEGTRLGTCARAGCDRVFADTSRGGRQSYCSPRCANTDAVRRHRRA
ncbi:CGNR zinc finger domain-containing protein [Tsukamurella spumae]|uniref:CGNR zinc finger domain-containing protein n=1 Tax=Tsukamurella spumae TaxID=44753 RepID=A0A846X5I7_9ACTN|nr:CGNR zinc finger domain-containing protein [Tsukamurella spumae]NKY20768.1 CGNR zinc finger domain-containing protein [Tsukamurella spumae]